MPAPKILSEGQWTIMLDYMEANPVFAKGNVANMSRHEAKEENNMRWKRLANRLNNVGSGCIKNYIKWREYWNNAKYKVRKKVVLIRKQINGTVIGETLLSRNEKRVLACLGIAKPVHVRMKGKLPPVSPILDAPQSPLDDGEPKQSDQDTTPSATPTPEETPPLQIKSEPDPHSPLAASPHYWVPMERKQPSHLDSVDIEPLTQRAAEDIQTKENLDPITSHRCATVSRDDVPMHDTIAVEDIQITQNLVPDNQAAPPAPPAPSTPHAPPAPEWIRDIEERRIAAEEKSARALQGIHANTEFCVSALQGIQFAQERLNKTMQGIQAALEASTRALLDRRN